MEEKKTRKKKKGKAHEGSLVRGFNLLDFFFSFLDIYQVPRQFLSFSFSVLLSFYTHARLRRVCFLSCPATAAAAAAAAAAFARLGFQFACLFASHTLISLSLLHHFSLLLAFISLLLFALHNQSRTHTTRIQ